MPLAPSADGRAVFRHPSVHHAPAPAPREAAPSESPHLGSLHSPWSWSVLPSAPQPAQGQKCGHCLGNKHSSGHLQPMNRGPGLPGAAGAPASLCRHTRAYQARTRAQAQHRHIGDPTPCCGQTGASSRACSRGPGHRPSVSLLRELCSLGPWGRRVSVSPLTGRGP